MSVSFQGNSASKGGDAQWSRVGIAAFGISANLGIVFFGSGYVAIAATLSIAVVGAAFLLRGK